MISSEFQTTTYGKWILAGEHAVLRGHGALVFPLSCKKLTLGYQPSSVDLRATYRGESGTEMQWLFWSVLEQGMRLLGKSINHVSGSFQLYSDIPIGAGMGASAALSVAMARWFHGQDLLEGLCPIQFARELEHLFHGQSSGLDIAGVNANSGLYFKQGECTELSPTWQPDWYLSSCGQIGITSHCISQVASLWEHASISASKIDNQMNQSVLKAQTALEQTNRSEAIMLLAEAMNEAAACFQQWGLISESLQKHMDELRAAGALAVKPTGSGGGGYVVSLWESVPPKLEIDLIFAQGYPVKTVVLGK